MGLISRVFYFFAPYANASERSVSLFFKGLTEHSDQARTRARLNELLQHDIAIINLWTEYRYKGYKYLRKSERRRLYGNLQLIVDDFERFRTERAQPGNAVAFHIQQVAPQARPDSNKAVLIQELMDYFAQKYEYRDSSSFGRLLRDPSREKLIGDCNQIVTLYIYLYSRYYSIDDLKVRLLPGHVALHYAGVDIETTNGTWANYDDRQGESLQPVEEIVSVNLLDTTDSYLATHEIAAEDFLQASRFAFILSHNRAIVTHNLEAAYGSLINGLMKRHNYHQALKFAKASRDMTLLGVVGHNGAVHEMQQHHYTAARKFADYAPKKIDLVRDSYRAEGAHHYDTHRYHDALKAFQKYGDQTLVRQCYEALFFAEQAKLGNNLTTESIKSYKSTIKSMQGYAKKSGNKKLIEHANQLHNHLS
jgi:hypothetical protein